VPELERLPSDHAPAVLAFELANRVCFATFISDRGEESFDHFDESLNELLAENEAGTSVFHVLVGENGEVLGRFNLIDLEDDTAQLGYRVAQQVSSHGVATATVQELCFRAAAHYGLCSLRAATTVDNVASQKVLNNAGFIPDGPAEPGGRPGSWYQRDLAV
jgi:[ribosomal protein S5]-alanine N-acetyltransferase